MTTTSRLIKLGPSAEHLDIDVSEWVAVYDPKHDLTWSRTMGARAVTQPKALEIASAVDLFGHKDWRLPTRAELLTLIDDTRVNPAIDVRFFPNCRADWYWTSTPFASSPSGIAWGVYFDGGFSYWSLQDDEGFVRAVRPGQSV